VGSNWQQVKLAILRSRFMAAGEDVMVLVTSDERTKECT
jgi:hypothetical protein